MRIWSRTTGEQLASLPGRGVPSRVVVASTGLFAAVFDDGVVMVWDSSSARVRWQRQAHAGVGSAMAFDASGRLLATGSADGAVKVWDARSGRILRTFALDDGTVRSVAFDSAGRRLAAAGWWLATIWPIDESSADVWSISVSNGLRDAQFSPDNHALATAHSISLVRLWDLDANSRRAGWRAHTGRAAGLSVRGGDGAVVSGGWDGWLRLWNAGAAAPQLALSHGTRVRAVGLSVSGRFAATAGVPGSVRVWDLERGEPRATLPHLGMTTAAQFSPDNRLIITGDEEGKVTAWPWQDARPSARWQQSSPDGEVLALSVRGDRVAVAHRGRVVVIRDLLSGAELGRFIPHTTPFAATFSADGRFVALGLWDGALELWDVTLGRTLWVSRHHTRLVTGVAFSPDGRLIASASRDGSVRLSDPARARGWPRWRPACWSRARRILRRRHSSGDRLYRWRGGDSRPDVLQPPHHGPRRLFLREAVRDARGLAPADGIPYEPRPLPEPFHRRPGPRHVALTKSRSPCFSLFASVRRIEQ